MKLLQLTIIIRDVETATMTAQSFTRAPVLIGREHGNQLRLDARTVSRRHGAFLFSKDGAQYIDYASANGSYVDGVRIEPNRSVDIRSSSVITIGPFQLVAHLNLVDTRRPANEAHVSTPVAATGGDVRKPGRSSSPSRASADLARHAVRIIEVVAEGLLAAGSRRAQTLSSLRLATSTDEMIALLLDPDGGEQRLNELRELLGELLRPRLTSVP